MITETDAFFYRLFNQLPQTFFDLVGVPKKRAAKYRFDSVELKKAFRIDGMFVPRGSNLPIYIAEVQFQRRKDFYANLFAKVFSYLGENNPRQEWIAAAIFPTRKQEPRDIRPYEDLIHSKRVMRIYLDEIVKGESQPAGFDILQLLFATMREAQEIAPRVIDKAQVEMPNSEQQSNVVELLEEMLLSRFPQMTREEMRMKFQLHDIRKSKVWQEARQEGHGEGKEEGRAEGRDEGIAAGKAEAYRELVEKHLRRGKSRQQIAEMLEISVDVLEQYLAKA